MAVTQYIGARYVPLFADPAEWSSAKTYEPLTIVLHEGNSFTSKQYVPKGIDISNTEFWAVTGNYNAQIEAYRRDTAAALQTGNAAQESAEAAQRSADDAQHSADDAQQAADDAQQAADDAQQAADDAQHDIDTLLPKSEFSASNTVKDYVDARIDEVDGSGITFESGYTENDFYTIFTVPKSKFEISLELVSGNPNASAPIDYFPRYMKPYLCMNISNTGNFIYNGILHGESTEQSEHGSIYALKGDTVDFDVFGQGSSLQAVLNQGYSSAISAWNMLRENGEDLTVDYTYSTYANPNPRQTLAWDADNWYVYTSYARMSLLENNGVYKNIYGKTMQQILNFCKAKGWPNVAAFDGGGSVYVASGQPFRNLSKNINAGYTRSAYMCVAFNIKED